jgi:hypothetical protein
MGMGNTVVSGLFNERASERAANAETRASEAAIAEQRRQFDLIRADQAPWQEVGRSALNQLARMFGIAPSGGAESPRIDPNTGQPIPQLTNAEGTPDYSAFFDSPDYRYALDQSQRAIERSAAARGGLASGGTLAALQRNASGLASQNLGNYVNRLASLAGVGQNANAALGNAGMTTGSNISNLLVQGGQSRASGILGGAAGWNQAFQNSRQNTLGALGYFFGGG